MGLIDGINGFFGGGAPPAYQTPQHIKDFMQPISVPEVQAVAHYQHLIDDKQGYQDADRAVKLAQQYLQTPDLSEGMKKKFQSDIDLYTKRRDAYAQDAEATRNSAAAIGLDVSDYGTDKTLNEANQAFLNHKNVAVQNFLNNMPTLDELQDNRYRELVARGASPRMAQSIVGDERGKMQSQLARRMGDFMTAYGKNPDGSIDQDLGILAMTRVLPDPQSVAQLFASGFAMPNKVYDTNQSFAQAMALAELNNQGAMDRTKWSGVNQLLMSREGNAAQDKRLATTLEAQKQESELDRAFQRQMKAAELAVKMAGTQKGNELAQEIEQLKQLGYDENIARIAVVGKKYSTLLNSHEKDVLDWGEIGRKYFGYEGEALLDFVAQRVGIKPSENREKLEEAGRLFNNTYGNIEAAIKAGNKDVALGKIAEMRGWLKDDLEYAKLLDRANYENTLQRLDVYEKIANGDPKSDEFATWLIKEKFKSEHGREPTHDEIQVEIAKAMKDGSYISPPRKPVKTPAMQPPSTKNQTSAPAYSFTGMPWQNPTNNVGTLPPGYGTGAIYPNR